MFQLALPFMTSMLRHALTLAAGALVNAKLMPTDQADGFVAACMLFAGIGWAVWNKINEPGMLTRLQARQAQKNVSAKMAEAGKVFSPSVSAFAVAAVALALGAVVLAPAPASAQSVWSAWSSTEQAKTKMKAKPRKAPSKVKKLANVDEPMKLGLGSLVQGVTGANPIEQLFDNLKKAGMEDLLYAKALADALKDDPKAQARSACYAAWIGMIASLSSAAASEAAVAKPAGIAMFTKFEQLSQVADSLAPLSSFQRACAPVAQAARMSIPQFVLGVITGGFSLGKLGVLP